MGNVGLRNYLVVKEERSTIAMKRSLNPVANDHRNVCRGVKLVNDVVALFGVNDVMALEI